MSSPMLPQKNPVLMPIIAELKSLRWKQAEVIDALDALEFHFGGLTEAQENNRLNAIHKFDQASEALCKLGIIAGRWTRDETED